MKRNRAVRTQKLRVTLPLGFETRSLPALTRSYPRHFTFYVARPARSIHQNRVAGFPSAIRVFALAHMPSQGVSPISLDRQPAVAISHRKVFSRKPLPP